MARMGFSVGKHASRHADGGADEITTALDLTALRMVAAYLVDDWEDNLLSSRIHGIPYLDSKLWMAKTFRPTWTQVSGTTTVSGGIVVMNELSEEISTPSTFITGSWQIDLLIDNLANSEYFRIIYQDSSNFWEMMNHAVDDVWRLRKSVATITTDVISSAWVEATGTYTMKVTRDASGNWEIFVGGVSKGTATDAWLPTATTLNLAMYSALQERWDNLMVW